MLFSEGLVDATAHPMVLSSRGEGQASPETTTTFGVAPDSGPKEGNRNERHAQTTKDVSRLH